MFKFLAQSLPRWNDLFLTGLCFVIGFSGTLQNSPILAADGKTETLKAEAKFEGPATVEFNKTIKLTIAGYDTLSDPKLMCFPENTQWEALRRLDTTPIVYFTPDKIGTYTFMLAANKDGKTILVAHTIVITPPVPETLPAPKEPPAQLPAEPAPMPMPTPAQLPAGKYDKALPAVGQNLNKLKEIFLALADQAKSMKSVVQVSATVKIVLKDYPDVAEATEAILKKDLMEPYDIRATTVLFLEISKSLKP